MASPFLQRGITLHSLDCDELVTHIDCHLVELVDEPHAKQDLTALWLVGCPGRRQ